LKISFIKTIKGAFIKPLFLFVSSSFPFAHFNVVFAQKAILQYISTNKIKKKDII